MKPAYVLAFRDFAEWPSRLFGFPAPLQFYFWFAVVFALKAISIFEPPVWDSAMGVFPPAIYLYESQLDIRGLLQEGNWWQGGSNVHSLSLFTWFVVFVMTLTDSAPATFAIIHLMTFVLFAWSVVVLTRLLTG